MKKFLFATAAVLEEIAKNLRHLAQEGTRQLPLPTRLIAADDPESEMMMGADPHILEVMKNVQVQEFA